MELSHMGCGATASSAATWAALAIGHEVSSVTPTLRMPATISISSRELAPPYMSVRVRQKCSTQSRTAATHLPPRDCTFLLPCFTRGRAAMNAVCSSCLHLNKSRAKLGFSFPRSSSSSSSRVQRGEQRIPRLKNGTWRTDGDMSHMDGGGLELDGFRYRTTRREGQGRRFHRMRLDCSIAREDGASSAMDRRATEEEGGRGGGRGVGVFRAGQRRGEIRLPAGALSITAREVLDENGEDLMSRIGMAIAGGMSLVVLMDGEKGGQGYGSGGGGSLYDAACSLRTLLRGRGSLFVAERADIAAASGADGVLLSEQGLPTVIARRMMQGAAAVSAAGDADVLPLVAQIVTSVEGGIKASAEGADLLIVKREAFGPAGSGIDLVGKMRSQVTIPVVVESMAPVPPVVAKVGSFEGKSIVQAGADGLMFSAREFFSGRQSADEVRACVADVMSALGCSPSTVESGDGKGVDEKLSRSMEPVKKTEAALPVLDGLGGNSTGSTEAAELAVGTGLRRTLMKMVESQTGQTRTGSVPLGTKLSVDQILDARAKVIIEEERALLSEIYDLLREATPEMGEISLLEDAIAQLDELFLLVVVGEFNSGKSSVINAILGHRYLREGVVPTTNEITLLKHSNEGREGTQERPERHPDGHVLRYLPADLLKQLNLVDTPGTNVILERQQRLTEEFVPRADLVLFVLSADRPFTESEVSFLRYIRQWGKKVIFILNKADVLSNQEELEEVVDFISDNAQRLLGVEQVRVYPVSARRALMAKLAHTFDRQLSRSMLSRDQDWSSSGFEQLERFIFDFLGGSGDAGRERLRLKLDTPLGIGAALLLACQRQLQAERAKVDADKEALRTITQQLQRYRTTMAKDSIAQRQRTTSLVDEASERGERFIDGALRLSNVQAVSKFIWSTGRGDGSSPGTANSSIGGFQREVIGTSVGDVKAVIQEHQSWLAFNNTRQLDNYIEFTRARWPNLTYARGGESAEDSVEGEARKLLANNYGDERAGLKIMKTQTAMDVIDDFDTTAAAIVLESALKDVIIGTLSGTAAAGVSGYVLTAVLPTTLEDLLAVAICSLGGYISILNLPLKRAEVKGKLRRAASALSQQLEKAIEEELKAAMQRVEKAVEVLAAPYRAAVEAEDERVANLNSRLEALDFQLREIRRRVQNFAE